MSLLSLKLQPQKSAPTQSRKKIIRLENLGVKYVIGSRRDNLKSRVIDTLLKRRIKEEIWALRGVNLQCFSGEIVGIIGSNGAGKTTLCRVLSGLINPDEGITEVFGTVSALFALGMGFRQHLSGKENIFLNGLMLGFSKQRLKNILPDIIEFSELGDFIDQPLKYYSSGMRSRLGFSIAAMMEPDVLILDEALSAGDLRFSEKAGNRLQELIKKSKLVLIVTHNMDFAEKYCSRIVWLRNGTVHADGLPGEIISMYMGSSQYTPRKKKRITLKETVASIGSHEVVSVKEAGVKFRLEQTSLAFLRSKFNSSKIRPDAKNDLWALQDISFKVWKGIFWGL